MTDFESIIRPFVVQPRHTPANVIPLANKKVENVIVEYGGGSTIRSAQGETSLQVTIYSIKYQKEKQSRFVTPMDRSPFDPAGTP